MDKVAAALDKLEKFRFPGSVPDKYMSRDALEAVAEYIEAVEEELDTAAAALKQLREVNAELAKQNMSLQSQAGTLHIKLSAIAMLLKA